MVREAAQFMPWASQTCLVRMVCGRQVLNWRSLKSFRTAVKDCDERVCGRNELIQPLKPIAARSTPTSNNSLVRIVEVSTPLAFRQAHPPQPTSCWMHVCPAGLQSLAAVQGAPEVLQVPPFTRALTAEFTLGLVLSS